MEHIAVIVHIFLAVLIAGTVWRLTAFHLMASGNSALEHLGKGMITQY
jgi:hypothetical protein